MARDAEGKPNRHTDSAGGDKQDPASESDQKSSLGMAILYRNGKPTGLEFDRRHRMSSSGRLRHNNLQIGSGTAQMRLQHIRHFRTRLPWRRARCQMRGPVLVVVTEKWRYQQDAFGNQLGVLLLFLLLVPFPRPQQCRGRECDHEDDRQTKCNDNASPQRGHSAAPTFSTSAVKM